ncbi:MULTISPECIES: hypothetical protein [Dyadobacter]|jgi:hypothetical protein|uniref:Uncharacterized protein n=1 Tax=Dyadobacter chenhuakuii TaxID=2909339 RepID=A0A9X1QDX8_9BACT|nr:MULTISPECIES: hypothetical protein [Dyadobacter]MCF2496095.1 hypothetical protein [Dyadobacter chenhuakuii]MCF2499546.1 hypothetical protein [Dyadobacter chenhuakuii]MCF2520046.1 hypothetical protein [Dyadobacter sp. CY351]USJ30160.1 hypothetical protein NFI80_20130 [Dyadobacter chenhuakuii]
MKHADTRKTILSLSNESFKHYLLLRYVDDSSDPKWKRLSFVSVELIAPEVWIQLHNYARADVESQGGRLIGYEVIDEKLVRHDSIRSNSWPADWMWVIQKRDN